MSISCSVFLSCRNYIKTCVDTYALNLGRYPINFGEGVDNQNTVYLDTPFYLKDGHGATSVLQSEHLDKMTAQFFMSSIKKVILQKYSYNAKATKIELKNTEISLPIKIDNTPDYDYINLFISAIQKLVIKDVVLYADKKIAAHHEVIQG